MWHRWKEAISGANAVLWTVCEHFCFSVKTFFLQHLAQVGGISGATRCSEQYAFSFLELIKFSSISRFVEVTQVKERCQRCQRGALNIMHTFLFFGPNFFLLIFRTGKREVSTVPTRCPVQYASIFVSRSKKFFIYINFWMSHRWKGGVNGAKVVP